MLIEVKQWPESKEVMDNPDWFFIMGTIPFSEAGDSVYARILDESEYVIIKHIRDKYTFSEYVNLYTDVERPRSEGESQSNYEKVQKL